MSARSLAPIGLAASILGVAAILTLAPLAGQTSVPAGQPAVALKTPWGDPDLQGKWPGIELVGVPMQRAANLGTRNILTEEEFKQQQERFARQAAQDEADFDIDSNATPPGGDVGGPVSPPPHWLERGKPQRIASLIVDPPDGRMPPLTPEAQKRNQDAIAARKASGRGPADSYTDRSLYDRCITRGLPGSMMPAIYGNSYEIVQAPDFVATVALAGKTLVEDKRARTVVAETYKAKGAAVRIAVAPGEYRVIVRRGTTLSRCEVSGGGVIDLDRCRSEAITAPRYGIELRSTT